MLTLPAIAVSLVINAASGCAVGTGPRWEEPYSDTLLEPRRFEVKPKSDTGSAAGRYRYDPTWPNLCPLFTDPRKRRTVPSCRY